MQLPTPLTYHYRFSCAHSTTPNSGCIAQDCPPHSVSDNSHSFPSDRGWIRSTPNSAPVQLALGQGRRRIPGHSSDVTRENFQGPQNRGAWKRVARLRKRKPGPIPTRFPDCAGAKKLPARKLPRRATTALRNGGGSSTLSIRMSGNALIILCAKNRACEGVAIRSLAGPYETAGGQKRAGRAGSASFWNRTHHYA